MHLIQRMMSHHDGLPIGRLAGWKTLYLGDLTAGVHHTVAFIFNGPRKLSWLLALLVMIFKTPSDYFVRLL